MGSLIHLHGYDAEIARRIGVVFDTHLIPLTLTMAWSSPSHVFMYFSSLSGRRVPIEDVKPLGPVLVAVNGDEVHVSPHRSGVNDWKIQVVARKPVAETVALAELQGRAKHMTLVDNSQSVIVGVDKSDAVVFIKVGARDVGSMAVMAEAGHGRTSLLDTMAVSSILAGLKFVVIDPGAQMTPVRRVIEPLFAGSDADTGLMAVRRLVDNRRAEAGEYRPHRIGRSVFDPVIVFIDNADRWSYGDERSVVVEDLFMMGPSVGVYPVAACSWMEHIAGVIMRGEHGPGDFQLHINQSSFYVRAAMPSASLIGKRTANIASRRGGLLGGLRRLAQRGA